MREHNSEYRASQDFSEFFSDFDAVCALFEAAFGISGALECSRNLGVRPHDLWTVDNGPVAVRAFHRRFVHRWRIRLLSRLDAGNRQRIAW